MSLNPSKILSFIGLIAIVLVTGLGIWWAQKVYFFEDNKKRVSREVALEEANNSLPKECDFKYEKIKKIKWNPDSSIASRLEKSVCAKIKDYKQSKVWKAELQLKEKTKAVSLIGTSLIPPDHYFVCSYAQKEEEVKSLKNSCNAFFEK